MIEFYLFAIVLIIVISIYVLWHYWRSHASHLEFYTCLDGHMVKSRGEWMIDAVLQYLGIPHDYEPRLQIGRQVIHPDFSLGHGIYVEYWGLHTKRYLKYRRLKLELYKRKDLHLINIEDSDLKNILYIFTQQLHPFKTQFPQLKSALTLQT